MKNRLNFRVVALAALMLSTGEALANAYLMAPDGRPIRNERGQCWRTVEWRPDLALRDCDPQHWAVADRKRRQREAERLAAAGPAAALSSSTPAALVEEVPKEPEVEVVEEVSLQPLVLNTDTSFRFGDYRLTREAQDTLQGLAGILHLRQAQDMTLTITGHTDRVGLPAANQQLGLRRAQAIKEALVEMGLDDAKIVVASKGASEPVTVAGDCPNDLVKCELIDCLRPDRRVVIDTRAKVTVKRKVSRPVSPPPTATTPATPEASGA